jgi:hypothetical protein
VEISHAYGHLIGKAIGVGIDGIGVVAATVMTPEIGQDDNELLVMIGNGDWRTVRYMDSYRADFVNATLPAGY